MKAARPLAGTPGKTRSGARASAGLIVGAGCSLGCPAAELLALIDATLAEAGASARDVRALATVDRRAQEPAMVQAAAHHGWPLRTLPADVLAGVDVPTPSAVVASHVGTPSVAEAAAVVTAGAAHLVVPKRRSAHATCAIAALPEAGLEGS
jgi:cobalamin biosynthesis protein CbiG